MSELKASEATLAGQAARIPAALKAQQAIAHATIQITRAETGKVEEYKIDFIPIPDEQPKEAD